MNSNNFLKSFTAGLSTGDNSEHTSKNSLLFDLAPKIEEINRDNNNKQHEINDIHDVSDEFCNSDEQVSIASSQNSLQNHQGSQNDVTAGESGSTSCSEDSFEMLNMCNERNEIYGDMQPCATNGNTGCSSEWASEGTSEYSEKNNRLRKVNESISSQLKQIDTGLTKLDFAKIEEELSNLESQRKLFRMRKIRETNANKIVEYNYRKKEKKLNRTQTNLAVRMQTSKNLSICFMSELSETETENGEDDSSEVENFFRRSQSFPFFENTTNINQLGSQSIQNLYKQLDEELCISDCDRCKLLKHETLKIMQLAARKADETLQNYRKERSKASEIPRQARQYLSKTKLNNILDIFHQIEEAINRKNKELVNLLMERDNLHMENDSLRVDIDDYAHQKSNLIFLDLKKLIRLQEEMN
ncbi:unnamed protein product [Caenorhabditis sp. 36 PRJEB53466]|nr:unnamed protein product [Caenorhabditis sp. 36 PRJEB53466]